ncbi:MAG: hypothetical protein JWM82_1685 [Myxococcales bacterium]|nr:hypothetical protein [Myxococcales bacterium]
MNGGRDEAAVPTAIRARRVAASPRRLAPVAVIAALAGLCTGLLVGWSMARPDRPASVPVALVPARARVVVPTLEPRAPIVPASRRAPVTTGGATAPHARQPRPGPEPGFAQVPWWSTVIGDTPYR